MNGKHFHSDEPCENCQGRLRYKSTHACVSCAKAHAYRRRGARVPQFDTLTGRPVHSEAPNRHVALVPAGTNGTSSAPSATDPLADLLGDL